MEFKKYDEDLQIAYGEVYVPGVVDSQGDFMTEEAIREMAHNFLRNLRVSQVDVMHNQQPCGAVVVESFLARPGDPTFISGGWVAGVHVPDRELWLQMKEGKLNGFSIGAQGKGEDVVIEIEVPEFVTGHTEKSEGHTHQFKVYFDELGQFLGGVTFEAVGHDHKIIKGTATEEVHGHSHRFSFIEELGNAS